MLSRRRSYCQINFMLFHVAVSSLLFDGAILPGCKGVSTEDHDRPVVVEDARHHHRPTTSRRTDATASRGGGVLRPVEESIRVFLLSRTTSGGDYDVTDLKDFVSTTTRSGILDRIVMNDTTITTTTPGHGQQQLGLCHLGVMGPYSISLPNSDLTVFPAYLPSWRD